MIITFFDDTATEKEYPDTDAGMLMAHLDMIEHVQAGKDCFVQYGNMGYLVQNMRQLGL